MSGPPDGKYQIQLAANPRPLIGVYPGPALEKPVIVGGVNNVVSHLFSFSADDICIIRSTPGLFFVCDGVCAN
jgi:hypothetical protein